MRAGNKKNMGAVLKRLIAYILKNINGSACLWHCVFWSVPLRISAAPCL